MRRILAICMVLAMIVPVGIASIGAEQATPQAEGKSTPRATYNLFDTQINFMNWGADMYIGQTEDPNYFPTKMQSFYMNLYTRYNREMYNGPAAAPWNVSYMESVNFTIDSVVDANYQPAAYSPLEFVQGNFWNGSGWGSAYPGPHSGWYSIWSDTNNWLTFKLRTVNVVPGTYFIKVRSDARVMSGYDGTNYTFTAVNDFDYLKFSVRSYLGPDTSPSMKMTITGINENNGQEPIYAGANYEKVGIQNAYNNQWMYPVSKINGVANCSEPKITIVTATVVAPSPQSLYFRMNIDKGTPAAVYTFGLKLSYRITGVYGGAWDISEGVALQTFTVAYTPLLTFPENVGMTVPVATLVQNSPNATFTVPVRNDGNIDLKGVRVRIDLDRASYFLNNNFFYDENYYDQQSYCDTFADIGTLKVGEVKDAVFSDVQIKNNLPPGKYLIQLDYYGFYYSDGLVKTSGDFLAGNYDEWGYYDYGNIIKAINYPEDQRSYSQIYPAIFVKVVDDDRGIELEATNYQPTQTYYPGTKNYPFYVQFFNRERYSFTDVKFTVHTDGTSPVKNQNVPDNDPMGVISQTWKWTNWGGNGNSLNFVFYADVKDIATPGMRFVPIDFEGYNPYNQKITKTYQWPVMIFPANPDIRMIRSSVDVSSSNVVGTITATLKNFGLGNARNATAFFVPNSGLRCLNDNIVIGDVLSDGLVNVTIQLVPNSPSNYLWGQQGGTLYIGYQTDTGNQVRIYSGPSIGITYMFQPKQPTFVVTSIEAPDLSAKKTVNVKVTITNTGGSMGENVNMMLINPNPQFGISGSLIQNLGNVAPGESKNVTYKMTTSSALALQTSYTFTLDFSYKRADGDVRTFQEGDRPSFTLRTKDRELSPLAQSKQMIEHSGYQFEIGYMMIGLFVMIGLYFLASGLKGRPQQPQQQAPPLMVQSTYQPPQRMDGNMKSVPPPAP